MKLGRIPLLATILILGLASVAEAQWASQVPATDKRTTIVWGATEQEAEKKALDECKKISTLCATSAATTQNMDHIFVTMCCTKPRSGCQISGAVTASEARKQSLEIFKKAGYSSCTMKSALRVKDGKPAR